MPQSYGFFRKKGFFMRKKRKISEKIAPEGEKNQNEPIRFRRKDLSLPPR